MRKYLNKYIILFLFVLSFVLFLSYVHPTFNIDEEYTIGLLQHSYKQLININMLDVHPPTYYLLLKTFLSISTFWTNSLIVKVLFGRIFSIIIFAIAFIFLHKIVKLSGIQINWIYQLIVYLMLCPVSLYATSLRMHGFSSFFNILEFYFLIKIYKCYKRKYLFLICICSILGAYMDYFSAVCAGVFIFIYLLKAALNKKVSLAIKLFISGIIFSLCISPLILNVIYQAHYRKQFMSDNAQSSVNLKSLIMSFTQGGKFLSIIIFILISITVIWICNNKNKLFKSILINIFLNYIISNVIAVFMCLFVNVYEFKFTYPQFSIYSFLLISVLIVSLKGHKKYLKYYCRLCLLLLCMLSINVIHTNFEQFIKPSIQLLDNVSSFKRNPHHLIYVNYRHIPSYFAQSDAPKQIYVTQESVYLHNLHKELYIKHSTPRCVARIVNYKSKLLQKTFNNLKFSK